MYICFQKNKMYWQKCIVINCLFLIIISIGIYLLSTWYQKCIITPAYIQNATVIKNGDLYDFSIDYNYTVLNTSFNNRVNFPVSSKNVYIYYDLTSWKKGKMANVSVWIDTPSKSEFEYYYYCPYPSGYYYIGGMMGIIFGSGMIFFGILIGSLHGLIKHPEYESV